MTTEENKALIRQLNDDFWNAGNAAVLDEVFAADYVDHNPAPGQPPGREGFRQAASIFQTALSDLHSTIDEMVAEGDRVAWRWSARATHSGPLLGVPATNRPITLAGVTIDRIDGGRIVERWSQTDNLGLLQQLGMIPAPPPASDRTEAEPAPADARTSASPSIGSSMTSKDVARRYFEAGDQDDLHAWDELCAPNMTLIPGFAPPVQGLDNIKHFTATFHAAFDPFFLRVEDLVAEGDTVVARWTTGGTQTAELPSPGGMIPPTGKEMAMEGMSIVHLADGLLVEERVQADVLGAMQQLGVLGPPPGD